MSRRLLAALLCLPAPALAQQALPDSLDLAAPTEAPELGYEDSHTLLRCQEGYVVARRAFLYRSLRAARRGQAAYRLRPGDQVYVVGLASPTPPRWLKVVRRPSLIGTVAHQYTDTYYLPRWALTDRAGRVTIFWLH